MKTRMCVCELYFNYSFLYVVLLRKKEKEYKTIKKNCVLFAYNQSFFFEKYSRFNNKFIEINHKISSWELMVKFR